MAIAGLSARLYVDHHVPHRLALELRQVGYDVVVAAAIGASRASDEQHLIWATSQGRVLLTFDAKDFLPLARRWEQEGQTHAGIIVSEPASILPLGVLLQRLLALLDRMSADDFVNQIRWLDATWIGE